ncbi:MAG: DUF1638 domain-containing protein [bacterium]|nr:DUF1638 domain-containing protein [bacterium]
MAAELRILVCGHFVREVTTVVASEGFADVEVIAFPARCGRPGLGWDEITGACDRPCDRAQVLGCACIAALEEPPAGRDEIRLHRVEQCFHLVACRGLVDGYLREGAYLLTPGWLARWRDHLSEWGFDRQGAQEFFAETVTRLILLDTGVERESPDRLREFAEHAGRPFEIVPVGLDHLRLALTQLVLEWRLERQQREAAAELARSRRQASDYAMAMDLVNRLADTLSEDEVVSRMLDLFTMLFAPGELYYLPWVDGKPGELRTAGSPGGGQMGGSPADRQPADPTAVRSQLTRCDIEHARSESGKGILLRIALRSETLGIVKLDRIAFPGFSEHYLNLAFSIAPVCALAIHHARAYQQVKQAEEQIAVSLREKEVLLREIHHRVKNNMQVITSLLRLQAKKIRDKEALAAFSDSQNRIRAMALVHETLYQSDYLAGVSCRDYLGKLVRSLSRAYGTPARAIRVVVDAADASMDVDHAIPVGLIVSELVTNAMKYAFPEDGGGEIRIAMHPAGEEELELVVGDDGVGLPEAIDLQSTATLGLRLVKRLAEDQLGATLGIHRAGGTRFTIRFRQEAAGGGKAPGASTNS